MDRTMLEQLQNATVYSTSGDKIGSVGQVYLDDQTEQPTFVTVKTGLFGTKETFVPLDKAQATEGGVTVPFEKDFVKDAPNVDADANLTPEEEQRIYEYYSMDYAGHDDRDGLRDDVRHDGVNGHDGVRDDRTAAGAAGTAGAAGAAGAAGVAATGDRRDDHRAEGVRADEPRHAAGHLDADRDRAADRDGVADGRTAADRDGVRDGVHDEESVVVRDEHLDVGTERRASGRVRLRKHSYTTTEQVEVPVQREEVVVERESVDPNSAEARAAGRGDDAVEVTTYEDVPVAEKTVDAEKVSLGKRTHQDTETVSEELQHEDVEVDRDGVRRDGAGRDGERR